MSSRPKVQTTYRLTRFGEFVTMHTAFGTPPMFWRDLWREVNRIAEEDGEWEARLREVEDGAREMRERFYQLNNPTMPERSSQPPAQPSSVPPEAPSSVPPAQSGDEDEDDESFASSSLRSSDGESRVDAVPDTDGSLG